MREWNHRQTPGNNREVCPGQPLEPIRAGRLSGASRRERLLPYPCTEEAVVPEGAYLLPATRGVTGSPNTIGIGTGLFILIIFSGHTGRAGCIGR